MCRRQLRPLPPRQAREPPRVRADEPADPWRSPIALHAPDFFTRALDLPLDAAVVIGGTFYAAPAAAAPLRLRIRFSPTIRQNVYSGLHLAVIHPDHGAICRRTRERGSGKIFVGGDHLVSRVVGLRGGQPWTVHC
jgi:hypothetical protein